MEQDPAREHRPIDRRAAAREQDPRERDPRGAPARQAQLRERREASARRDVPERSLRGLRDSILLREHQRRSLRQGEHQWRSLRQRELTVTDQGQKDVPRDAQKDPRDSAPAEGSTVRERTEEMDAHREDQVRTEEMTDAKAVKEATEGPDSAPAGRLTVTEATEGTTGVTAVRIGAAALETARTASPERTHPFPHLLWRDRNPREPKEKERMTTRRKITAAMKTRG